jgi:hypothetical protein
MSAYIDSHSLPNLSHHCNLSVLYEKLDICHLDIEKATELIAVALKRSLRVNSKLTLAILLHCELPMTHQTFSEEVLA